jgi:hypothetical protein
VPWWFFVAVIGGPLVLTGAVLFTVFSLIRRAVAAAAAGLVSEGIELDSGPVPVITRYRQFRAPGMYLVAGVNRSSGRIVLTKKRLHVIKRPQRYGIIEREWLAHFSVGIDAGRLHIHATDPPGATGTIDYHVPVSDPEQWVSALRAAGARDALTE